MKANPKIAVVGAGSWGTATANLLCEQSKYEVVIWGRDSHQMAHIQSKKENQKYLKGITLSSKLNATTDLTSLLRESEIIVCSIPTQQIESVFGPHVSSMTKKIIVNTSKGIELGTHRRVSQIFEAMVPSARYAILSGPTFAQEIAQKLPAAATLASLHKEVLVQLQQLFSCNYFRAYTSPDVVGVELAGALKNVVAIATGIASGLKLGYNAQAAIINRGIAEMIRAGKTWGANPFTFLGLAGTGDLVLTCTGPLSRNRRLGIALGEGKSLEQTRTELGGVAEGYFTAKSAFELSEKHHIPMPITEQVFRILYENRTSIQALGELMGRELRDEWEHIVS
jgi:glycerol-3-phosphate dehydrogenase (NAD(P)+)